VLLEDFPGLAKTLMARSFAQVCSMDFSRIQFTPDLMPSDVTGSSVYNQRDADFQFRPGPIFANLLLADGSSVTIRTFYPLAPDRMRVCAWALGPKEESPSAPPPFLVMATQNPIEYEGTYPLPEAQLDRFLLRMSVRSER
jgi:MoxR-like ATPase